jgi:uncharacterized protein
MEGEKQFLVKVHKSYRWVVAICDVNVFGKKLIEGERVLDLSGGFFEGEAMGEEMAERIIIDANKEDATFNIAGEKSVALAKKLGLVKDEGIGEISGIPFALVLL